MEVEAQKDGVGRIQCRHGFYERSNQSESSNNLIDDENNDDVKELDTS